MSDIDNLALRARLADPAVGRPDPAFTATVLRRWGLRQRRRRRLARLLVGAGILGPLAVLAPQAVRSILGLAAGPGPALLAACLAGGLVALSLVLLPRASR
jgi:hypothetical protein